MKNINIGGTAIKVSLLSLIVAMAAHAGEAEKSKSATADKKASSAKTSASRASSKAKYTGKITESAAVNLVMNLPEVKEFFKNARASKRSKPTVELDRKEGNAYVVHVFEVVSDGPDEAHTATMNWYNVDIKTGKIKKEF